MNEPKPSTHLSEAELARIILTVPSIFDRARIWGHIAAMKVHNDTQSSKRGGQGDATPLTSSARPFRR